MYLEPPPTSAIIATPYLKEEMICELIFKVAASGVVVFNANGTWYGRKAEDGDDNTSYQRIRHYAYRTINEMKNYLLALPEAASSVTPIAAPVQSGSQTPIPASVPVTPVSSGGISTGPYTPVSPGVPSPIPASPVTHFNTKNAGPANSINLMGKFDGWNLSANKPISKFTIEFSDLDVGKIKQILQRIPSGFQESMSITYNEDD